MILKVIEFILPKKDSRGRKIGKNIIMLIIFQTINILSSFLLIPLTIDYISASQYGIWLTISSIIGWFSLVDIGFGSGLRNKLAEAIAKDDKVLAKVYVSTTYVSLSCIIGIIFSVLLIINRYINWSIILNQPEEMASILLKTMFVVITFFALRLIVQLIGTILTANMLPAIATGILTFSNILVLVTIFILSKLTIGNLYLLSWILSAIPVLCYIIVSIALFNGKYKYLRPSIGFFRKDKVKEILSLGIGFFIINISTTILFQTSNIFIIHFFSNDDVVIYNIAYKLFSIILVLFSILIQPFWTGYTDAWIKHDIEWIKQAIGKLFFIWKLLFMLGIILLILSPFIYNIWIGKNIVIPLNLSLFICIYFIIHCYGGIFNIFINGVGKIRLQLIALVIVTLLYVPILLVLVKIFNWGLISIPIALILSNFYSLFIARIQYKKIISGEAQGIWNK